MHGEMMSVLILEVVNTKAALTWRRIKVPPNPNASIYGRRFDRLISTSSEPTNSQVPALRITYLCTFLQEDTDTYPSNCAEAQILQVEYAFLLLIIVGFSHHIRRYPHFGRQPL